MTIIEKAYLVAENAHKGQTYGIYPYIYHIRQVYYIAKNFGLSDEILVAAILHDVLEDSDFSYNDIKKAFGEEIAEIVYAITDELGRNRYERKSKTYPKIKRNWKATIIKICDRIANINESIVSDPNRLQMYKKEHIEFTKALRNSRHPKIVGRAWSKLDSIMDSI